MRSAARYRLLRSVVDFLRSATDATPHVLVLEDLHNADAGTLDLLQYLSRHLAELRLLVLGTYRESEKNASIPCRGHSPNFTGMHSSCASPLAVYLPMSCCAWPRRSPVEPFP